MDIDYYKKQAKLEAKIESSNIVSHTDWSQAKCFSAGTTGTSGRNQHEYRLL